MEESLTQPPGVCVEAVLCTNLEIPKNALPTLANARQDAKLANLVSRSA